MGWSRSKDGTKVAREGGGGQAGTGQDFSNSDPYSVWVTQRVPTRSFRVVKSGSLGWGCRSQLSWELVIGFSVRTTG
jgi:hypothetical protein